MFLRPTRLRHLVTCGAIAAAVALACNGCSSSTGVPTVSSTEDSGATSDSGLLTRPSLDGQAEGSAEASAMYDGTVGKACSSDVDCQPAGGPGTNFCSTAGLSTPVCVGPSCDPGNDSNLHFCDGPDDPSSPGICIATATGGTCLPNCLALADGSAPMGCVGTDVCNVQGYASDQNNQIIGAFGYCFGGCLKNADCPTGTKCQPDRGECTTTVNTATKAAGSLCTDLDNTSGACNCVIGGEPTGVCAPFCITGSASAACPSGFVCDSGEQNRVPTGVDASAPGLPIENPGLSGLCFRSCGGAGDAGQSPLPLDASGEASVDGSGETDGANEDAIAVTAPAAGTCPIPTTCVTVETAGPDCLPQ